MHSNQHACSITHYSKALNTTQKPPNHNTTNQNTTQHSTTEVHFILLNIKQNREHIIKL